MLTLECIANSSKPPFHLQLALTLHSHRQTQTLWNPFWHSIHFIYVIMLLLLFIPHVAARFRPFWSLFCRLAHVTRIFAQLKSIKLHFRLNKLGCHTSTRPLSLLSLPLLVQYQLHCLCTCLDCCPRSLSRQPFANPNSLCQTLNILFSQSLVFPSLFFILCFWTLTLLLS